MTRAPRRPFARPRACLTAAAALLACAGSLRARQWSFTNVPDPVEAEFVALRNDYVVLTGANGTSSEVPLAAFRPADRQFIRLLTAGAGGRQPLRAPDKPVTRAGGYRVETHQSIEGEMIAPAAACEVRLTGGDDPLRGSSVHFTATDGWLFLERIPPSVVIGKFLDRMLVNGAPAQPDVNVRVVAHGPGAVIIPHPPDFPALTVFEDQALGGTSAPLKCHVKYGAQQLGEALPAVRSFILRRGYMATLAENENGTGISRNYVAQDHDVVADELPAGLDRAVRFIRVFPWRWAGKKGIAGGIHQNLDVDWFYDWNIAANSSPDLEYVPIRQKRWWPGLDQDWKARGATHLLGYNEPDRPDQANMPVGDALSSWPDLLATGLRLGSPAVSDGGLNWLYQFIDEADKRDLRVDFVAVHYYRAVPDPGDGRAAAAQFHGFLEQIHDRTRRPVWVTEWNNGANWTPHRDPTAAEQKRAIEAMIRMLDETPFVERYALYNWVEDGRMLVRKDGSLTPAGEAWRDHRAPVAFAQPKRP